MDNFRDIVEWFSGVDWYIEHVENVTTTKTGYTSVLRSNGTGANNYEIVQLPLSETTVQPIVTYKLNPAPVFGAFLVLLGVFTVLGFIKRCIKR